MSMINPTKMYFPATGSWYDMRASRVGLNWNVALGVYQIAAGSAPYPVDNMGASNREWVVNGQVDVSGGTFTSANGFLDMGVIGSLILNPGSKLFYDDGLTYNVQGVNSAVGSPVIEIKSFRCDRDTSTARYGAEVGYVMNYTMGLVESK